MSKSEVQAPVPPVFRRGKVLRFLLQKEQGYVSMRWKGERTEDEPQES
jgi:hypothetical protein